MYSNYLFGDAVARLNVAKATRVLSVDLYYSKTVLEMVNLLYRAGLIRSFVVSSTATKIRVNLKYNKGRCVFNKLSLISKPSRRIYWDLVKLERKREFYNDTSFYIISTSKGLYMDGECHFMKLSGEVLLKVVI